MKPYVRSIEQATLKNGYFRQVLFTGEHSQLCYDVFAAHVV